MYIQKTINDTIIYQATHKTWKSHHFNPLCSAFLTTEKSFIGRNVPFFNFFSSLRFFLFLGFCVIYLLSFMYEYMSITLKNNFYFHWVFPFKRVMLLFSFVIYRFYFQCIGLFFVMVRVVWITNLLDKMERFFLLKK